MEVMELIMPGEETIWWWVSLLLIVLERKHTIIFEKCTFYLTLLSPPLDLWLHSLFVKGGSVKGGRILGEYPEDITDEGPLTLGRGKYTIIQNWLFMMICFYLNLLLYFHLFLHSSGRMIPTTPWEAPFRGIAAWLGINQHMDYVCPNLYKFDSSYLIDVDKMFGGVEQPLTP
jgi:hypothetical protein